MITIWLVHIFATAAHDFGPAAAAAGNMGLLLKQIAFMFSAHILCSASY